MLPDILLQPLEQRRQVAAYDIVLQRWDRFVGRLEQLRGIHGTQRIRREITKPAVGPVNILHTTVAVIPDGIDAQIFLHLAVPQGRNIVNFNVTFHQCFFDFITQNHVSRIAQFISVNADETRLNALVEFHKVAFIQPFAMAELLDYQRVN